MVLVLVGAVWLLEQTSSIVERLLRSGGGVEDNRDEARRRTGHGS